MITAIKGSSKLLITKGTFEEQLKPLGYQIASEDKGATRKVAPLIENKEEEKPNTSLFENENENENEEKNLSKKFGLEGEKSTSKKGR